MHALVFDLAPTDGELAEGALKSAGGEGEVHALGKNTFLKKAYLPPDPPPGGGAHRYVFQVYALDRIHGLDEGAGRGAVKDALRGHVLARGRLGTRNPERETAAPRRPAQKEKVTPPLTEWAS